MPNLSNIFYARVCHAGTVMCTERRRFDGSTLMQRFLAWPRCKMSKVFVAWLFDFSFPVVVPVVQYVLSVVSRMYASRTEAAEDAMLTVTQS